MLPPVVILQESRISSGPIFGGQAIIPNKPLPYLVVLNVLLDTDPLRKVILLTPHPLRFYLFPPTALVASLAYPVVLALPPHRVKGAEPLKNKFPPLLDKERGTQGVRSPLY